MATKKQLIELLLAEQPEPRVLFDPKWGESKGRASARRMMRLCGHLCDPRLITVSDRAPEDVELWSEVDSEAEVALAVREGMLGWIKLAYGGTKSGRWVRDRAASPIEVRCASPVDAQRLVGLLAGLGRSASVVDGTVVRVREDNNNG